MLRIGPLTRPRPPRSARPRLALLGITFIGAGLVLLSYVVAIGAGIGAGRDLAIRIPVPTPELGGEQIYQASCGACHGGASGGAIDDHPPRHNASGHTWQHPDCELTAVIRTGQVPAGWSVAGSAPTPPGVSMPAYRDRLTAAETASVLAYIKTMWTAEQREAQARVTLSSCSERMR